MLLMCHSRFLLQAGEYGKECSSTGAVCSNCAAGMYKTTDPSSSPPSVFADKCNACAACPAGTWRSGCGGAAEGTCESCLPMTYKTEGVEGSYLTACSACNSSSCGEGFYLDGCGEGSSGGCLPCAGCPVWPFLCDGTEWDDVQ